MQAGIIGLGRMGGNLARTAAAKGHEITGYSTTPAQAQALARDGVRAASSVRELVAGLSSPRVVILYVPHGDATEQVCTELLPLLSDGDIVVDGGNSHWEDSTRRAERFARQGVRFLDAGTSGGIPGAQHGACFMVGGDRDAFEHVRPLLEDLAVSPEAVLHTGPSGSGHFAKLTHNAIEFGMVQAIAEGVELLFRSGYDYDFEAVFNNWCNGSVIRGWLVELMRDTLAQHPDWRQLSTYVEDTQEVKWVIEWALEHDVPLPVVSESQTALMAYRDRDWPAAKAVALLRHAYGGHPVHRLDEPVGAGRR